MADPTRALFFISRMLAASEAPPVSRWMRSSRKGVMAAPLRPFASASFSAREMAASTLAPSAASASGIGTPAAPAK